MRRKRLGISKTVAAFAVLVAALGCEADSSKSPNSQFASPVTPIPPQQVSIKSSRSTLTVGNNDVFAVLTVTGLTAQFTPLPNGTEAVLSTNLGAFDSPSGGQTTTLLLFGGTAQTNFYAGATEGSARVTATINGITAQVTITIKGEPEPPEPAPTESKLTLICSPNVLGEEDPGDPLTTECQGTVTDQKGDPFKNAGVRLESSDGLGEFDSSSGLISVTHKTDAAGFYSDTLSISKSDLIAFLGSSFTVTAYLGTETGELAQAFEISIVPGAAPPVPTTVVLTASVSFVTEGANPAPIDLDATVFDQNNNELEDVNVVFTSTLGSPSPLSDATNSSGVAESSLDLTQGDVDNHPTSSFTLTAKVTTSNGTISSTPVIINIVGDDPAEAFNVVLEANVNFILDNGGAPEVVLLTATVFDQFGVEFEGGPVAFTSSLVGATIVPLSDTSDSNGEVASTLTASAANVTNHPSNTFTVTATLTRPSGGPDTATINITIVRPPIADFNFVYQPPVVSGVTSTVIFTDTSSGSPTSWSWDFDTVAGASVDSTLQNPTHDFTLDACFSGPCSVALTATNAAGASTVTKIIVVPAP